MGLRGAGLTSRSRLAGRIGDLVVVSGAVLCLANRRGWVSDQTAARLGAPSSPGDRDVSISQLVLAGAAALRLLQAARSRRTSA